MNYICLLLRRVKDTGPVTFPRPARFLPRTRGGAGREGGGVFDWITGIVDRTGYLGVALLMFAENLFPPVPSELIMPLAGFAAARGDLSLPLVLAAGVAGSLAGALFWYWIGRKVGADRLKRWAGRHGRWLTLSPGDVDEADA